jgi:hypothetical protein
MVLEPTVPLYDTGLEKGFVPFPPDLGGLKQRALNSMLPSMRPNVSLLNSLVELKDFRGLVRGLLSKGGFLKSLFQGKHTLREVRELLINRIKTARLQLSLLKRGNRNALLRELDAAVAAYLQWKFAVSPLISDLQGIRAALAGLEKKMNNLISREGKPRRHHFTSGVTPLLDWESQDTFNMGYPLYPDVYGISEIRTARGSASSQFHAEIEFNYNFTQYQREHARLLTLLDNLGINFNPKIIWDALKYTFIIDWVIGVGQYLDQFKTSNMEPQINIRKFLWSYKVFSRTDWSKRIGFDPGGAYQAMYTPQWTPMPSVSETAYKRRVEGISVSSVLLSGLTLNEFSLGAALVYARRRRRKQSK